MFLSSALRHIPMVRLPSATAAASTATALKRAASSSPGSEPRPAKAQRHSRGEDFDFFPATPRSKDHIKKPPAFHIDQQPSRRNHGEARRLTFPGPLHDISHIIATFSSHTCLNALDQAMASTPRSALRNYLDKMDIEYNPHSQIGEMNGRQVVRCTISVDLPHHAISFIGIGDAPQSSHKAETAACLSLLYQLHNSGRLYDNPNVATTLLSNKQCISYDQAAEFIEFYCRTFSFQKPVIESNPRASKRESWDSIMTIAGRKVGFATSRSKKLSVQKATLDVVRYLEECDPELWQEFVRKSRTGDSLGDAPRMSLFIPRDIRQDIRDLCVDIHHSQLYAANAGATVVTPPPHTARFGGTSPVNMNAKSKELSARRAKYLAEPSLETMRTTRMTLPVYSCKDEVLKVIDENDVSIFMAATGSGKTTQIPQMILDHYIDQGRGAHCNVICTQPRRLAALGVATRVADERGERLGQSVGYSVRFDVRSPQDHGSITFSTIGVFLKQLQAAFSNPSGPVWLDHVTHVLVDEVHERDIDTDLLLVVLKAFLADRKARGVPLKIVLMSATIDGSLFQNYFPDDQGQPAPIAEIPGRSYPVDKTFLEDIIPQIENTCDARVLRDPLVQKFLMNEQQLQESVDTDLPFPLIAATISHVISVSTEGHVLVFLPGWEEISRVEKALKLESWRVNFNLPKYELHILHSSIPLDKQQAIFTRPEPGIRRIILTTNIAETSVTIPDVVYVVDSARLKETRYDPDRQLTSLVTSWIGRSNLNQRAGRAGRHRNGYYFGVLTKARAESLSVYQTVEMARADLTNVVMHVKAMNFKDMSIHEVLAASIEPPDPVRVDAAIDSLQTSRALDDEESLTAMGRILLQIPVTMHLGRLILYGSFFRCLDQAVTLAAIMSSRDPWLAPPMRRKEAREAKEKWVTKDFSSDPLTSLAAFNYWSASSDRLGVDWFNQNFISRITFQTILKTRNQLIHSLGKAGILSLAGNDVDESYRIPVALTENSASLPTLSALITVATMPKFAVPTSSNIFRTRQDRKAIIHPSSVNATIGTDKKVQFGQFVSFLEKRVVLGDATDRTSQLAGTTLVNLMTYTLFGSHKQEVGEDIVRCDDWIVFNSTPEVMDVLRLRQYLDRALLRMFAGIALAGNGGTRRRSGYYTETESEDDVSVAVQPLSATELEELALLSRDCVRILEKYNKERLMFMRS